MFSNPKHTFSAPPAFCISPLPLLSASPPHLSSMIFLHAQLHDCYLLVVKLLLHAPLLKLYALSAAPSLYSLSLISQMIWFKSVFFSFMLSISVSHLSDLHVLGPNVVVLWCLTVLVGSSLRSCLFNSFPATMFGNCFWKCFWLNPVIMDSIWSLVTSIGWDLGACIMLGIAFYLFATGKCL